MKTEEQRLLLGELNPQERQDLRNSEYWETCLTSWLDSARPSSIREWLKGPRETFLRWMDSRAWGLALAVEHRMEDETEALKELFPMWETEMEDDELDSETPLTPEEEKSVRDLFLPE